MAAKEQQLIELEGEYGKLKQDHDRAMQRLQEELEAVKELGEQLAALSKILLNISMYTTLGRKRVEIGKLANSSRKQAELSIES